MDPLGILYARYVAKNLVAAGAARKCEIQVAYAIGVPQPVSILVDTFGTGKVGNGRIVEAVRKLFDFRPATIITQLDLKRPIFRKTAAYGHFGREEEGFTWEVADRAAAIKDALGSSEPDPHPTKRSVA